MLSQQKFVSVQSWVFSLASLLVFNEHVLYKVELRGCMMPEYLVDDEGYVYEKGFDGQWHQKWGWFGPQKDTNWLGQPNVKRDLLGRPKEARGPFGGFVTDKTGKLLYEPSDSGSTTSYGGDSSSGSADLEGLIALGILILIVFIVITVFNAWRGLAERYPRAMAVIHTLAGMAAVVYGLAYAGFPPSVQIGGAALVPGLVGWLWLTRHLPLIFMPINAILTGAGLWLVAEIMRVTWEPTWSRLTIGLPLLSNLAALLAILPMTLLLWFYLGQRWPPLFAPLNCLVAGATLWFLLTRVWTDWFSSWGIWTQPIPVLLPVGWLIFLGPLILWLWYQGQVRWPAFFFFLNLLAFGGLLGLTAYHTQTSWIDHWDRWTGGLLFNSVPLLVISLSPITLGSWIWASRRWERIFIVPNLLLTGAGLGFVLIHTRHLWTDQWREFWGNVPARPDPVMAALIAPLAIWLWRQGIQRLPSYRGAMWALFWGVIFWWVAERSRANWQDVWWKFAEDAIPDLALLAGLMLPVLWAWYQSYKRWPRVITIYTLVIITLGLFWTIGRILTGSDIVFRVCVAVFPIMLWSWGRLLSLHPRIGWLLTALGLTALGLLAWLAPRFFEVFVRTFRIWLESQGIPIGINKP